METEMPQRFLRPALRTSERWNSISRNAQALWLSILMTCDDYGRYHARDSLLWADAFVMWNELHPKEQVEMSLIQLLKDELIRAKLAEFYEEDGKQFVQLCQWSERARGESKFPEPPLRNPAESCGILPPSPSPLVIVPSHKPSPMPAGLVEEMKLCIGAAFKRDKNAFWHAGEEHRLFEVCQRPDVKLEWVELSEFRVKPDSYFPQKIGSLLEDWTGTLDRARNHKEHNAINAGTRKTVDRNAGTYNAGKAAQYANVGKRPPVAIPDTQSGHDSPP